jgi:DUF1365 family protein
MAALNSCLFECQVYHQRLAPKKHRFQNRCFFFYLDLDELPQLENRFTWFKTGRRAFYEFRESDHLPTPAGGLLKDRAIQAFKEQGLQEPIAKIGLLTNMRTLGYVFNPISLYFAFDAAGRCLGSLAQVENTFREMKVFPILNASSNLSDDPANTFSSERIKYFYVSPYSQLDQRFRFQVSPPGERIQCQVSSLAGEETLLDSGFRGEKRPLTDSQLVRLSLRYPLMTWQVIALIHWHALILWIKRLPLHLKESQLFNQRQVLRPRPDLQQFYAQQEARP